MKRYYSCIFVLFFLNARAQLKTFSGRNITAAQLDNFIHQQMGSLGLPGISIAYINDNHIVYHRAFGVSDGAIFEAASMSKTAFAYLVMKEVEKGVINLDTPLYRYMVYPDMAQDNRYQLITARMVLSHQSGFPNWRYFETPDSALHIKYGDLWLKFTPGTDFGYSGEGYHYLAQVIAYLHHLDIKTLDAFYQQEVSKPLGLQHFYFSGNDYITTHKVSGYRNGKAYAGPGLLLSQRRILPGLDLREACIRRQRTMPVS